ncbi:hypothetical protein J8273_6112 [Carpediemonas membranifera]|uniref:Phage integrase family protein n=1 Tax=Carpediemonas membranifera TaxID=201153 RepID=A0A8J6B202_9EUKA|nr:hypothetical protein J8273_6112 [Carpediemonas membranifera]|eukprot:KAG9392569.1 hypothetical protein J8273_6112 [Carpediemonas membranifera]
MLSGFVDKRHVAGVLQQFSGFWGALPPDTSSIEVIRAWAKDQASRVTKDTITSKWSLIRRFFGRVSSWEPPLDADAVIKEQARNALGKLRGPALPIRAHTLVDRLRAAHPQSRDDDLWKEAFAFALTTYATTSRPGEIYALHVGDVRAESARRGLRISIHGTKTRRVVVEKLVPRVDGELDPAHWLSEVLVNRIDAGAVAEDPLWSHPYLVIEDQVKGIISTQARLHGLRRGSAADLVLMGIPIPVVAAKGTWADQNSLIRYVEDVLRLDYSTSVAPFRALLEKDKKR